MTKRGRVSNGEQTRLLTTVVERARKAASNRAPVVVFDLDGTLLDNRPRSVAILHELADHWNDDKAHVASMLRAAESHALAYLFDENLRNLGVSDQALIDEALAFWKDRFFTDDYLRHDLAHAGAVEFARALHDAGATIVYFTGRDLPNMALGSLASLRDLGFPIGMHGTQLILKPDPEIPDPEFKRDVTPKLERAGEVIATFENEPANANIFAELYPEAEHFLIDTQHVPDPPPLTETVHVIGDFRMKA